MEKKDAVYISLAWLKNNILSLLDAETRIYVEARLDNAPTLDIETSKSEGESDSQDKPKRGTIDGKSEILC